VVFETCQRTDSHTEKQTDKHTDSHTDRNTSNPSRWQSNCNSSFGKCLLLATLSELSTSGDCEHACGCECNRYSLYTVSQKRMTPRAGKWHRYCRQMPRAYHVQGAYKRWLQHILNICYSQSVNNVLRIVSNKLSILGRPFVKRFALCYRTVVCLSVCLSVTLVHCGQIVSRIKMKLGTQVGLGPGHIVLDGNPAPPPPKGHSSPIFGPFPLRPNVPISWDSSSSLLSRTLHQCTGLRLQNGYKETCLIIFVTIDSHTTNSSEETELYNSK